MGRRRVYPPVSRAQLLQAVENTYDDARFIVGVACREDDSFLEGLRLNRSEFWTKEALMKAISESPFTEFPGIPEMEDHLVINPRLFVYRNLINEEQVFPQPVCIDGFIHVEDRGRPHYDFYFKIDHEAKTITFALGERRKILPLREHTEWSWKLKRSELLCGDSKQLEQDFTDDFWSGRVVRLGRKALGIKDVI